MATVPKDRLTHWRFEDWKRVVLRTREDVNRHFLGLAAAGVAFYSLLGLFPALAAAVAIFGLLLDPATVQSQLAGLMDVMPEQAAGLLQGRLEALAAESSTSLGLGAVLGLLVALWSATKGVKALFKSLNMAYEEPETRGWFKLNGLALLFTLGGIVFLLLAVGLIAVLPALMGLLGMEGLGRLLAQWLRWPLLLALMVLALGVVYRWGPSRPSPSWRWLSPGALLATGLWLLASILFSVYVGSFSNYDQTYGSLGAVVILMMWLFLSAFAVLIGAEFNSELERQGS
ncbi:YihY/virulence factor BrkB family protein [Alkalilimnicola sp. S0819]|uniref:YihY/virulence factor BrkB family protein n=1 Tax=Alkalilimnicola sp. S0819 TaxID=2613922 RepID=UPI001261F7BD|nr:YihY/virulence factor BrkB family protein [Alkalilimnicola sp. S0819]KAB7628323.1 YihY/virulence factor BrkB family protein [Alkalilimnicola sp. S0819]MPQ15221.1 YihY family inner membrane protein [Alkalilimnicola sp. S0819]